MSTRGGADGGVEDVLRQVRELIDAAVTQHRGQLAGSRLINTVDGGYEEILRMAKELIDGAEETIDIIHGRDVRLEGYPPDALRRLLRSDLDTIRVRVLSAPALLDEGFVQEQVGRERQVAIKVGRIPPIQALLVDGIRALVVAESALGRRASVVEAPEVLLALRTLMEGVWRGAVPAHERISFGDQARAAQARQILGFLREGVTDEVAARELTVSVRTYRRYVAEIMTLLGARSRFQAGVRAAELRLLATSWTSGATGHEPRWQTPGRRVAAS
ncbi:LuxR family transcriptional regulator [Streptomyces coffeae]|uniref:LuxR family transcriptional regulator n=1 Tax=Streptomyces coffeae TaxID=621382 RepID=UPI001F2EDB2D|nr:LuxR family transcriptional regulator [Streptomyces coffeae]